MDPVPRSGAITIGKCGLQNVTDRFGPEGRIAVRDRERQAFGFTTLGIHTPVTWPGQDPDQSDTPDGATNIYRIVPAMQSHRNNLTALSQTYNLYFVAYQGRIFVYRPRAAPEQLLTKLPEVQLVPRRTPSGASVPGHLDYHRPHTINHVITGMFGEREIVVACYDDGDVVAYDIRGVWEEVLHKDEARSAAAAEGLKALRQPHASTLPFLSQNVGKSAWGLAIHSRSRLIAVSSNMHEVTVFAVALKLDPEAHPHVPNMPTCEGCGDMEAQVKRRQRAWRIVVALGEGASNIPNVSFIDDEEGDAEKVCGMDINGKAWIADIWKPEEHCTYLAASDQPQSAFGRNGWGVFPLPIESFLVVKRMRDLFGGDTQHTHQDGPLSCINISPLLEFIPDDPCRPTRRTLNRFSSVGSQAPAANHSQESWDTGVMGGLAASLPPDNFPFGIQPHPTMGMVMNNQPVPGSDLDEGTNTAPDPTGANPEASATVGEVEDNTPDPLSTSEESDGQTAEDGAEEHDAENGEGMQEQEQDDAVNDGSHVSDPESLSESEDADESPEHLPGLLTGWPTGHENQAAESPEVFGQFLNDDYFGAENPLGVNQPPPDAPSPGPAEHPWGTGPLTMQAVFHSVAAEMHSHMVPNHANFPYAPMPNMLPNGPPHLWDGSMGAVHDDSSLQEPWMLTVASAERRLWLNGEVISTKRNPNRWPLSSACCGTSYLPAVGGPVFLPMVYMPHKALMLSPVEAPLQQNKVNERAGLFSDPAFSGISKRYRFLLTYATDLALLAPVATDVQTDAPIPEIRCTNAIPKAMDVPPQVGRLFHATDRLSMLAQIPELSLLVIGSATGRVLLVTPTRLEGSNRSVYGNTWRYGFRIEAVLPRASDEEKNKGCHGRRPLHGLAVGPAMYASSGTKTETPSGPKRYRVVLHYRDHDIWTYEVGRERNEGRLCIF